MAANCSLSNGPENQVWPVAIFPNGRRIVTGSDDGTVDIYTTASPEKAEAWRKDEQPAAK